MRVVFLILLSVCSLFSQDQSVENMLEEHIKYVADEENLIGYLSLEKDRSINQSTYIKFKFAFDHFREKNVRFVLLKLNTPGGQVFPAQKICRLMQELDVEYGIPVVAYIDNWAISAGAMLAYSSRFIATTPQSSMGAAEPVTQSTEGAQTASEKVNSALRSEFANLARFYSRDPVLAQAMVDKEMIVVERDGKFISLSTEKKIKSSDTIISQKGKLLTLDAKQLTEFGISDFEVPFQKELEKVSGMVPFNQSPLFEVPFFSKMENATLITYTDWKVNFFSFLSHPIVSTILLIGLIIGIYIELSTPGFGLFGIIGLSCLGLILLSSFAIYAVNWLELILLVVGATLLLLEIFVIPGFGVAGIVGSLLFIAGLFALMVPNISNVSFDFSQLNLEAIDILYRLAWFGLGFVVAFLAIFLLSKYVLPSMLSRSPLILRGAQERKLGYTSGPEEALLPKVGEEGLSFSSLRPSGKVSIKNEIYDAIAETGYIEKDQPIVVIAIKAKRLIVRKK